MAALATGVGSMPGEDFAEAARIVLGELGDLPHLPELPARGPHAAMTARALALVTDIGVDLQPEGWRITAASGVDHRRAVALLSRDLDLLEELAPPDLDHLKVQVAGPWTLAATVERPRGDRVVADPGARRDLAQALAEGVARHVADVNRRFSGVGTLVVQVDEPGLPAVLAGRVPTASGLHRHRSVAAAESAEALGWVLDAVRSGGALPVLHCCADEVPVSALREVDLHALSLDVARVSRATFEDLAAWVDSGRQLWPGVVPTAEPPGGANDADLTRTLLTWWADLGWADAAALPEQVVTPSCGLAGGTPEWARRACELSARVASNLTPG
jgi:methionine synthase II (cobalamin-independent)